MKENYLDNTIYTSGRKLLHLLGSNFTNSTSTFTTPIRLLSYHQNEPPVVTGIQYPHPAINPTLNLTPTQVDLSHVSVSIISKDWPLPVISINQEPPSYPGKDNMCYLYWGCFPSSGWLLKQCVFSHVISGE